MNTIRCGECGFENDLSRKFCQNCGTRLEAAAEQSPPSEAPAKRTRQPTPTRSRRPGVVRTLLREFVWTAVLAAIVAALVQALRAPDFVPPALPARPQLASLLAADIQAARESSYPRALEISSEAANNFLASRIMGSEGTDGLRARFERSYFVPGQGTLTLGVEQRLRNYPVFLQLHAVPISEDSKTTIHLTGGSIGRLPIPEKLAPFFARSFTSVLANLEAPLGWFSNASSIKVSPTGVTASWPGRATP